MSAALRPYEQLTEATDDKTRARLIAEAFDALKTRYPRIAELATQGHVRESELRLQKEIKQLDLKISEVEGRLRSDIARIKVDLLKWLPPTMLAQVAAIAALIKLL